MRPKRPRASSKRKAAVADGYRSSFEKTFADDLKARGIKFTYEQDKFEYFKPVRGGKCGSCGSSATSKRGIYTPDFRIRDEFWELKGRLTSADRTKLAAVVKCNPGLRLRILFAVDNWCTKLRRERYSGWAARVGIPYHVGKFLPESWITEGSKGTESDADILRGPSLLPPGLGGSKPRVKGGKRTARARG